MAVGSLVVLALLASTSVGTLFVPVLLMRLPGRLRAGWVLGYLVTITVGYLAFGVLIVLGAEAAADRFGDNLDGWPADWWKLGLGVWMFVLSLRFVPKRRADRGKPLAAYWSDRVRRAADSPRTLARFTLSEGLLEDGTMFPYLGALLLVDPRLDPVAAVALLSGYSLLIILPALVLLAMRLALPERTGPILTTVDTFFDRHAAGVTGWILATGGVLITMDAVVRLASSPGG
ncbi:MAG TPA: GAP family protein [Actinophytocola sp.]|uniref:GAP family protein n=1 Tax=Actinophytocola sp. TaxID=1872138 RepID=UPI002DB765DF|nr:GAP family protein [Actinophytocola sp.]HEU5471006.1 GAP family protein [Actinophytocola sp.]